MFCDATLFTSDTIKDTAWSLPRLPIRLDKRKVDGEKPFNILAAISKEHGVEHYSVIAGHVNSTHVVKMLKGIAKKGKKAVVFTDNASYFKSNLTKTVAKKLFNERLVWNVPYQPKLNPIEKANRVVKEDYKRRRL